jgi:hypothetical protein
MKLTLLYGVLTLSNSYPGRVLAVDDLREVLASASSAATVRARAHTHTHAHTHTCTRTHRGYYYGHTPGSDHMCASK